LPPVTRPAMALGISFFSKTPEMILVTAMEHNRVLGKGFQIVALPTTIEIARFLHLKHCSSIQYLCNRPRAVSPLVSTGTGHYDICFVLPSISSCTISFGAAACSLTHFHSPYRCPISCSLYCIGMTCGGPCSAPNY